MNQINELKNAFDELVAAVATIKPSEDDPDLCQVSINLLFGSETIGASDPDCKVPFTLRLQRAVLWTELDENSQVGIVKALESGQRYESIRDEIEEVRDGGYSVSLGADMAYQPSVTATGPKRRTTKTTIIERCETEVDFDDKPSKNAKERMFRLYPGSKNPKTLFGKPWDPNETVLVLKDERPTATRKNDAKHDTQPILKLRIVCKEEDWDFEFGGKGQSWNPLNRRQVTENEVAGKSIVRKMLVSSGLAAGQLGDGTAFFDMAVFEARVP